LEILKKRGGINAIQLQKARAEPLTDFFLIQRLP
jgi:hypothetical protein